MAIDDTTALAIMEKQGNVMNPTKDVPKIKVGIVDTTLMHVFKDALISRLPGYNKETENGHYVCTNNEDVAELLGLPYAAFDYTRPKGCF